MVIRKKLYRENTLLESAESAIDLFSTQTARFQQYLSIFYAFFFVIFYI